MAIALAAMAWTPGARLIVGRRGSILSLKRNRPHRRLAPSIWTCRAVTERISRAEPCRFVQNNRPLSYGAGIVEEAFRPVAPDSR
jgi:hypothetical protein